MVQRGQYNEAFTKALMASDLPVVIDLLEMVDQSKIFLAAGGSTLEAKRQNFNSADESAFSSPSPTSITDTTFTRSTLTPSPPTQIAPPAPPPPPPPPLLAPNFKRIVAPPAPPKPNRSITKLKNGYYADSESNCGSIDRRQMRQKKPEVEKYEKVKSDLISGVDDFFDNRPVSRNNHCRTRTTPNRPLSRLSTFTESLPVESDTETRLEQFFLMNKY